MILINGTLVQVVVILTDKANDKDSGTMDLWYAQLEVMKKVWDNDYDDVWDELDK